MSLSRATNAEFIALTAPLLDKQSPLRDALEATEGLRWIVPQLIEAHRALVKIVPSSNPAAAQQIGVEQKALDLRHDDLVRGIDAVLEGFAWLSDDPGERRAWRALRDRLLPDGISLVNRSYREEAGHAASLAATLEADHKARLKSAPIPGGTLSTALQALLDRARALGALETQKDALLAPQESPEVLKVRARWLKSIGVVRAVSAVSEEARPEALEAFLASLGATERAAALRVSPPELPAPTPPVPAPTPEG